MERLSDAEIKLMTLLWAHNPIGAKELAQQASRAIGWNKNTTYTVAGKLVAKNAVERREPGFVCVAIASKEDVLLCEIDDIIAKLCRGSVRSFFKTLLFAGRLSWWDLHELGEMIEAIKSGEADQIP